MSYIQRISDTSSPFAQVYNSTDWWDIDTRPDTKSQTWLSASTFNNNSYEFSGAGYIFGFMTAAATSLGRIYLAENDEFYKSGNYHYEVNSDWVISDDEMIGYGDIVGHQQGSNLSWGIYTSSSRLNVIRLEV